MGLGLGQQVLRQPNLNHCREWQVHREVGGWASGDHQRTGLWVQEEKAGVGPWKRALTTDMSLVAKVSCSLLQIKLFKHSLSGLSAQGRSYTSRVTAMLTQCPAGPGA